MNNEIWQQLLSLESRDMTTQWFSLIHGRELNAQRAREINSSAKQAREYFLNASNSNYSVRPLLTFYGVASLSRALVLLFKSRGGEETLAGSHGLETVDWGSILSGETSKGLRGLSKLRIRTCVGSFNDLLNQTKNQTAIHIRSSSVEWSLNYSIPERGIELTLGELFSRLPDLSKDHIAVSDEVSFCPVSDVEYSQQDGFTMKMRDATFSAVREFFEKAGYAIACSNSVATVSCDAATLNSNKPLFIHTYVQKHLGVIPGLHVCTPFNGNKYYSQICMTYMTSYVLGMLVRYYPTHWISLINGDKGDAWWPTINRAQQYVENSFPELVIEMIAYTLKTSGQLSK